MTKHIAVICNNKKEWEYFTESATWSLSKQNSPYKLSGDTLIDIQNNQKFIHIPNNMYKLDQILYMLVDDEFSIDNLVWMSDYNQEIKDYLSNWRK